MSPQATGVEIADSDIKRLSPLGTDHNTGTRATKPPSLNIDVGDPIVLSEKRCVPLVVGVNVAG